MKKLIIILIIIALIIGGGIYLVNKFPSLNILNKVTNLNVTSTIKEILPASEFISLHYYYTDVITHSNAIKFLNLGNIPFTEKKAIYTIDGTIKLGINCKDVNISSSVNSIILNMPAIKIISHEVFPETFNLYDEKSGLFNRYKLEDAYAIQSVQRLEREKKVNEDANLFEQARSSTEQQFRRLLESVPGIKGNYEIVFVWEE